MVFDKTIHKIYPLWKMPGNYNTQAIALIFQVKLSKFSVLKDSFCTC